MPLIKNNRLVDDPWTVLDDGAALPSDEKIDVAVRYDRWREEYDVLLSRKGRLGVTLSSDQPPALIEDDLERLDLVVVDFPKFTDGRGFSTARLLRERYGFTGEIRAAGHWIRDQMVFLKRCGVDAFSVSDEQSLAGWLEAQREISVVYQPAADDRSWVSRLRSDRAARSAAVVQSAAAE